MQTPQKPKEGASVVDLPTTPTTTDNNQPPTTPQSSQYVWRCRCCNSTHLHTPSPSSRKHPSTPKTPRQRDFESSPSKKQQKDRIKSTPSKSSLLATKKPDDSSAVLGDSHRPIPSTPSKKRAPSTKAHTDAQIQEILRQASPPRDLQASEDERDEPEPIERPRRPVPAPHRTQPHPLEPIMEVDQESQAGPSSHSNQAFEMDIDTPSRTAQATTSTSTSDPDPQSNLTPELIASLLASDPTDSISHTLPIYLSSSLSPTLQLFQYPLHHRPLTVSPYAQSKGHTITARMKEAVERFELEVPVDMREEVWDEEKAEEMGFEGRGGMGGSGGVKEEKRRGSRGTAGAGGDGWGGKMRLRSEEVPHVTGYWSGIVHDNALHIHPINKLIQLRPSLGYLDDLDKKKRNEEARRKRRGAGGGDDDSGDEDDDDLEDGGAGKKKGAGAGGDELKSVTMQLASLPSLSHDSETRRTTKMGTGGTIGLTSQIRARIVKALKHEMEDVWKTWNWVDGDLDEVGEALDRLILPDEYKTVLKCQTKNLDLISRKNIGDGAKLPN